MKKLCFLALAAISLTGCWTRIFTVAPTAEAVVPVKTVYTTEVTTPSPKHTTVTTVTVTSYNTDLSFYLDLNAVAAAFAEARTVAEFEQLLNSSRYMINNLDLNRDGWIDYLRVIETHRGVYHTFLIQACLAPAVYQDVATLIAEHRPNALYVEVVGDRWLYGPNYIVRPVFIKRPPLWDIFGRPAYVAWNSPYYYNYWPSYYQKPKPIYLNHYQAYVKTYMSNHHYCHQCDYPSVVFYSSYNQMVQPNSHQDYANQHPNDSFEKRVTHELAVSGSGVSVRNAGQLRTETQREAAKTSTSSTSVSTSTATSRTSGTSASSSSSSSSRASGTSGASTRQSGTTTSTSSSSSRQSSSTSATTRTSSSSLSTTTNKSASTSVQTRQPSTSVNTRVNKSGETRTTIKMTDENGRTQTVQRTSGTTVRNASAPSSSSNVRSSQGTTSGSTPRSSQRGR